jgi:hypothetical protein
MRIFFDFPFFCEQVDAERIRTLPAYDVHRYGNFPDFLLRSIKSHLKSIKHIVVIVKPKFKIQLKMERKCSQCKASKFDEYYSLNQWKKGDGTSRCRSCVAGYECQECYRNFNTPNELKMHLQTHRPQNVACPLCGEDRFRSTANVVQHVESGSCSGCPGKSNAKVMVRNITDIPSHAVDGDYECNDVADFPCPDCNKCFPHCSQLCQHIDNKHGKQTLLLGH